MNINLREVRLTAYALGELDGADRAALEAELAGDPAGRRLVEEVRAGAAALQAAFRAEPGIDMGDIQRLALATRLEAMEGGALGQMEEHARLRGLRHDRFSWAVAAAAALVFAAGGAAGILAAGFQRAEAALLAGEPGPGMASPRITGASLASRAAPRGAPLGFARSLSAGLGSHSPHQVAAPDGPVLDNPFVRVIDNPLSTLPIHVNNSSLGELRQCLLEDRLPPKGVVRIEEMVNAFRYGYLPPEDRQVPFAGHTEVHSCPWNARHRLAKIALKARAGQRTEDGRIVARDAAVSVEFNPAMVLAFRLIGYENRALTADEERDGLDRSGDLDREVGTGHEVTALYEIVPAGQPLPGAQPSPLNDLRYQAPARLTAASHSDELLTVNVAFRLPDDSTGAPARVAQFAAVDQPRANYDPDPTPSFQLAAAVAQFGMILRDSPYRGKASYDGVIRLAAQSIEKSPSDTDKADLDMRRDFVAMVEKARSLRQVKD